MSHVVRDQNQPDLSKWITVDGRIRQYPRRPTDRAALLRFVADRIIDDGEVLTEREINGRLAVISDDVAALRRYLVVAGHLDRTPDGAEYRPAIGERHISE